MFFSSKLSHSVPMSFGCALNYSFSLLLSSSSSSRVHLVVTTTSLFTPLACRGISGIQPRPELARDNNCAHWEDTQGRYGGPVPGNGRAAADAQGYLDQPGDLFLLCIPQQNADALFSHPIPPSRIPHKEGSFIESNRTAPSPGTATASS